MQSKEEHNDGGNEDCGTDEIELTDALDYRMANGVVFAVDVEIEDNDRDYDGSNWEAGRHC